ncbi:MAG: Ca2+-binding EF-hand superfamily protein, partial [Candidatus Azotimanducaceae bacterium]
LGLIGLATCALSTNVAAEPRGHFPIIIADVEVRQAQRFDVLDKDNDDTVTQAEFENGPGLDRKMHRKHRSRHGRHENSRGDRKEQHMAMRKSVDTELFKILDTDGDGSLSSAEHSARDRKSKGLARKRAMFAKLDANSDGKLTETELPSRAERLKEADSNQDGKVTRSEMASMRRATRQAG